MGSKQKTLPLTHFLSEYRTLGDGSSASNSSLIAALSPQLPFGWVSSQALDCSVLLSFGGHQFRSLGSSVTFTRCDVETQLACLVYSIKDHQGGGKGILKRGYAICNCKFPLFSLFTLEGRIVAAFSKNKKRAHFSDGCRSLLWLIICWNISMCLKLAALPDRDNQLSQYTGKTAQCSSVAFGILSFDCV